MNPEPQTNHISPDSKFASLNKEMVQKAIESQHQKKTSLLAKIKNRKTILTPTKPQENMTASAKLSSDLARWRDTKFELSYFSQLVEDLYSREKVKQYRGLIGVRRFLSIDHPNIQPVVDAKLVPKIIEFLRMEDEPEIQIEAAWILTNVASGTTEQLKEVMNKGAVPAFVRILHSKNKDLREQAIWAFGNICGDSAHNRDIVLKHGGLPPLLKAMNEPEANKYTIMRGTWALSNMCRGRPLPSTSYTAEAIPTFCWILSTQGDEETLQDAAWALSYLTRSPDKIDSLISDQAFLEKLAGHLESAYLSIVMPCLNVTRNLLGKNSKNAQAFLNLPRFLPRICDLLGHRKKAIQKEAISILSGLILNSAEYIHKLIPTLTFLPNFVEVMNKNRETRTQRNALKAISHLFQAIDSQALKSVIQEDILSIFVGVFDDNIGFKYLCSSLETLEVIFKFGVTLTPEDSLHINRILTFLEEKGVLDDLLQLQQQTPYKYIHAKLLQLIMLYIPSVELIPRSFSSSESEGSEDSDSDS